MVDIVLWIFGVLALHYVDYLARKEVEYILGDGVSAYGVETDLLLSLYDLEGHSSLLDVVSLERAKCANF